MPWVQAMGPGTDRIPRWSSHAASDPIAMGKVCLSMGLVGRAYRLWLVVQAQRHWHNRDWLLALAVVLGLSLGLVLLERPKNPRYPDLM